MKRFFLVILLFYISFLTFAQGRQAKASNILRNPDNEEVHIIPDEGQSLITNTVIKFQALIQDVRPGQVEIEAPQETRGFSVISAFPDRWNDQCKTGVPLDNA